MYFEFITMEKLTSSLRVCCCSTITLFRTFLSLAIRLSASPRFGEGCLVLDGGLKIRASFHGLNIYLLIYYLIFLVGDILLWGLLDRIFPTNPGLLTVWPLKPLAPPRGLAFTGKLELESPLILMPGPSDFRLFLFRSSWIPFRLGFDWAGNDWRICWFLSNFDSLISDVPLRRSINATSSWWGPHRCNTVRGVSAGYDMV